MRLGITGILAILTSASALAAPRRHPTTDIAPKDAPVVSPLGQVVDRTIPAYQPQFLARQPLVGRYEERKWAYLNTYVAYPFYGCGYWGGYGFGYCGFGGWGGSALGSSIQTGFGWSH